MSWHLRDSINIQTPLALGRAHGSPATANAEDQKQPRPSCPTGDNVWCSQLIFL